MFFFGSENNKFKEIVLEEVTVYNYPNSEKLYDVESIYLCFSKDNIIIESAKLKENGKK